MHAHVVRTEPLTDAMVRVVLGGAGLDAFEMVSATDAYLNLAFPPPEATYPEIFDPAGVRADRPKSEWPSRRRFTVRRWDEQARELTVDFVVHGDEGVAGRWAGAATVGDVLVFDGPSGGYRPEPAVDWHLFVGDESALPAVAAALESLTASATAVARLVCDGPEQEVELDSAASVDIEWSHRRGADDPDALLARAVEGIEFPPGEGQAFVHGEAEEIRAVRRHLLQDRGWTRAAMSCSPYWRRTMTDEAWRTVKPEFVAAMEADTRDGA